MTFNELSEYFQKISLETSRNKMTEYLGELYTKANPEEAQIISYLSLGTLKPPYINSQFNFAQKSIEKVIAQLLDMDLSDFKSVVKQTGDIGLAITTLKWPFEDTGLSVKSVYDSLSLMKSITGVGSQEEKVSFLKDILKKVNALSASYIVRIIIGTMRLGFSDMTLIDALSWMCVSDKSLKRNIEEAYNLCADIGLIARFLKEEDIKGLDHIHPTIGIPIRLAAAERAVNAQAIFERLGPCVAQPKLDGFRLQIHIDKSGDKPKIWFFSRNLQDMSYMFPDLIEELEDVDLKNIIMEGEAIVYDEQTQTFLPFQETVKRKRKHGIEEVLTTLPLTLFMFDILLLDDEILIENSQSYRRKILLSVFEDYPSDKILVIEERFCKSAEELENYFNEEITRGVEGLVVKRPDAPYQAGKRNFNWIKLKRYEQGKLTDTIDGVVLGYYYGRGRRVSFGIGAFLVGVYNKQFDRFETIAKIGTGLTDDEWKDLKSRCDKLKVLEQPHNVFCLPELKPDIWVDPQIVVVIAADEITRSPMHTAAKTEEQLGLALRFPRFLGYSLDKLPTQATSVIELRELYDLQFSGK